MASCVKKGQPTRKIPAGYQLVPPDGAWGWVVLGGIILCGLIVVVPTMCFGLLLNDLLLLMDTTTATAAWVPSLNIAMSMFMAPACAMICESYSCRTAGIAGGLMAATGMFLSYFATRIEVLFLTYGILVGSGMGLSLNANFIVLSQYFRKYYGIMTGVALASYACGRLVMTPIIQLVLNEYGMKGTFLVIAALLLNICVGASLFQPVGGHLRLAPADVEDPAAARLDDVDLLSKKESEAEEKLQLLADHDTRVRANNDEKWVEMANMSNGKIARPAGDSVRSSSSAKPATPPRLEDCDYGRSMLHLASPLDVFGSVETIRPKTTSLSEEGPPPPPPPPEKPGGCCQRLQQLGPFAKLDFGVLHEPIFYLLCIGGVINYVTAVYANVFLPSLGLENQMTAMEGATILSIRAGSEIVGRIAAPFILHQLHLPLRYLYLALTVFTSVFTAGMALMTTFLTMSAVVAIAGVTFGGQTGLFIVLMVHNLGASRLPSVLSLSQFIQGLATLIVGPIIGLLRDEFGTYRSCFFCLAVMQLFLALCWTLKPIVIVRRTPTTDATAAPSA